ncbi:MAG: ABC transporter permease [Cellulosilyticaceae bacterium]
MVTAERLAVYGELVELAYEEKALDVATIKAMQKGEVESTEPLVKAFVAWHEEAGQQLENTELSRKTEGQVITFYGDMSLLILNQAIDGTQVYTEDKEGVVITQAVAYELWGDTRVVGQEMTIGEKTYKVRGVVDDKIPAVFRYEEAEETSYTTLRLQMMEVNNIRDHVQTLGFRYNLPFGILRNFSLTTIVIEHGIRLPLWILGIYTLIRLYKYVYRLRKQKGVFYVACIFTIAVSYVLLQTMDIRVNLPEYMIPSKWSDFAFWTKELESLWQNKEQIGTMATYLPQRWYEKLIGQCGISLVLTIGFQCLLHSYLFFRKNDKIKS